MTCREDIVDQDKKWYDTVEGIEAHLSTLADFNRLVDARHAAGYEREERMIEYIVLGRYRMDTCGNLMVLKGDWHDAIIPARDIPGFPNIVREDEFWHQYSSATGKSLNSSMAVLPPPEAVCPACGRGWDVSNCTDVMRRHEDKELQGKVGQTIYQMRRQLNFNSRGTEAYTTQKDLMVLSPRFIDPTSRPGSKRAQGWASAADGITEDYVLQGDEYVFFNVWTYMHPACEEARVKMETLQSFGSAFTKAGFKEISFEEITNEYGSQGYRGAWYHVTTEVGVISVGWRKRIIQVSWEAPVDGNVMFGKDEGTTIGTQYIHAWGYDKLAEYLETLRKAIALKL